MWLIEIAAFLIIISVSLPRWSDASLPCDRVLGFLYLQVGVACAFAFALVFEPCVSVRFFLAR
jgi:hypothetical protein